MNRISDIKYRYENFGGIISSEDPPFLAFVDRNYMLDMGLKSSELWQKKDSIGILSAPTEVHFAITNKCSVKCSHCYMGSDVSEENEYDTKTFKRALDVLSEMNVFHIAMGGGEALEREDLFEVAEYAREKGLVPNLTTSGSIMNDELAQKLKIFGQVNLSIDGLYDNYNIFRKSQVKFDTIDKSIDILMRNNIPTGINCVVGKRNYGMIPEIFEYASKKGLNEIEFLRFKPLGRGIDRYNSERTTYEQNIKLIPLLTKMSEKYKIIAKIDCSFVPMLCYHKPPKELLYSMATYGCEAGNVLLGIKSN
ncbi:MAG: radical SAM protein, partial [Candidatus Delongbacteria bacterium]|nr:radical SAM protein [Candidatus Delongbacteria bacterium]